MLTLLRIGPPAEELGKSAIRGAAILFCRVQGAHHGHAAAEQRQRYEGFRGCNHRGSELTAMDRAAGADALPDAREMCVFFLPFRGRSVERRSLIVTLPVPFLTWRTAILSFDCSSMPSATSRPSRPRWPNSPADERVRSERRRPRAQDQGAAHPAGVAHAPAAEEGRADLATDQERAHLAGRDERASDAFL